MGTIKVIPILLLTLLLCFLVSSAFGQIDQSKLDRSIEQRKLEKSKKELELSDVAAYNEARRINTKSAYEQYIKAYPLGQKVADARKQISLLNYTKRDISPKSEFKIEVYSNARYEGYMLNKLKHGKGTLTWENGSKYEGDWKNDLRTGSGTLTWENGDQYIGDWKDNFMNGVGTLTWANGNKYEGGWKDDSRSGTGTFTWANGDWYEGEWKGDKMNGAGKLSVTEFDMINCPDCRTYVGNWQDGVKSGKGKCFDKNGKLIYDGQFANDLPIDIYPSFGKSIENSVKPIANSNRSVNGVVASKNGKLLPGATVQIKGTSKGTITDIEGKFGLNCSNTITLIVSYYGFKTTEVLVDKNQSNINVIYLEKMKKSIFGELKKTASIGLSGGLGYDFLNFSNENGNIIKDTLARKIIGNIGFDLAFSPNNYNGFGALSGIKIGNEGFYATNEKFTFFSLHVPLYAVYMFDLILFDHFEEAFFKGGVIGNYNFLSYYKNYNINYTERSTYRNPVVRPLNFNWSIGFGIGNFKSNALSLTYTRSFNNYINKEFTRVINGYNLKPFENTIFSKNEFLITYTWFFGKRY